MLNTRNAAKKALCNIPIRGFKVGFYGLGNMGIPMCNNIIKSGNEVQAYDVFPGAREAAKAAGLEVTEDEASCAKGVDFIVTCLPNGGIVGDLLTKEGGIFESADKGTLVCDVSTILPADSQKFFE
jgi:3-hydroxyisobutyrate dehydrogenase-like beta-hydroxyacid dehydrogenase